MSGGAPEPATGRVVVAGSLHLDVIVDAPRLPRRDETLMGEAVSYHLGGKGGNQAVAAARMGAPVTIAGRIGRDAFGAQIRAGLEAAGVDLSQLQDDPGASGMSVALVDAGGDYGAVVVTAANAALDPAAISLPADAAILCLQNEVPEPVNLALIALAGDAGVPIILNAAPARPVESKLMAAVALLVVNRLEAADLTGTENPETAACALAGAGPDAAIVTLGPGGLMVCRRGGAPLHMPGIAVTAISTHGAGDMFTGALAAALAGGNGLEQALPFAQAAAALHVATPVERRATITAGAVRALSQGKAEPA